jgi:hypothetical protein
MRDTSVAALFPGAGDCGPTSRSSGPDDVREEHVLPNRLGGPVRIRTKR